MNVRFRPIKLLKHAVLGFIPFGGRHCVACERPVHGFLPYRGGLRGLPPLMRELDIVGSDVERFECPRCGAHDRERHLLLYLRHTRLLDRVAEGAVVHFAPERTLTRLLRKRFGNNYVACDLLPQAADVACVDLSAMPFASDSVGLLMANHVLEHVHDLDDALLEIHRVLRYDGFAVMQTPYSSVLESTWEDAGVAGPSQRLQAYGQEDHVRLFGCDVFKRIEAAGLSFVGGPHHKLLPDCDARFYGVNPAEPFMLFSKSAGSGPI